MKRPGPGAFGGTPLVTPLYQSVVYGSATPDALDDIYNGAPGFTYSREGHPNAVSVGAMIDRLEGVSGGVMTGSGMAAVSLALLSVLKAGDHAIGSTQLYGRSLRLMTEELPRLGIETGFFDPTDADTARAAIRPDTKAILVEVVANPTLRIADMTALAELAEAHDITLIVDNTFTTPLGYRPLVHGAHIVLHSVTKILAGHSDAMLGWVGSRDPALTERLEVLGATLGTTAAPFDCWLAERGLLSFPLRFERVCANAKGLAKALADTPGVTRVFYPTQNDHPDYARAHNLLGDCGGHMLSFEIAGGREAANRLSEALDMPLAPTLGDITTTISHPATSSHRALPAAEREALGISEGFFRLSVGVEPLEALTQTLRSAIAAAS
ncbi:MAG: PLP-dependent transferase [Pseudomonadota bacterium]